MKWEVVYHPAVEADDLPKIPRNLQARIQRAIETRLFVSPTSYGGPLRKSLKGHRKLRVGDYRIIYRLISSKQTVAILLIVHRKEAYEKIIERITV